MIMVLEIEFSLLDDGSDGEHNSVGFVEISTISMTQDGRFCGTMSLDWV